MDSATPIQFVAPTEDHSDDLGENFYAVPYIFVLPSRLSILLSNLSLSMNIENQDNSFLKFAFPKNHIISFELGLPPGRKCQT